MVPHHFFYQLALLVIIWLFVMLHLTGSKPGRPVPPMPAKPKRKRSTEPKAFEGLTQKPPVCYVNKRPARLLRHLPDGPIPCRYRTDALVPWTPQRISVRTPIVIIAVGSG
jgi:hypothetical protein